MRSDRNKLLTEFFQMQRELERLFDDFLKSGQATSSVDANIWHPSADVYETVDSFIIKMEIAGLDPDEDIKILLKGKLLEVQGQRRDRDGTKKEHYHQAEVSYGPFRREILLPEELDEGTTSQANYQNGFLEIVLPKPAKPQPQKIVVEVKDENQTENKDQPT